MFNWISSIQTLIIEWSFDHLVHNGFNKIQNESSVGQDRSCFFTNSYRLKLIEYYLFFYKEKVELLTWFSESFVVDLFKSVETFEDI